MKKLTISIITAVALTVNVNASGIIAGATEITQVAQWGSDTAAWAADYAKQASQLETQINQLQQDIETVRMMTQNLEDLSSFDWTDFAVSLTGLQNAMQQNNALSYSMANYDQMFSDHYKGYSDYYDIANDGSLTPGEKATSFSNQYQKINQTTRNTVKGTLDGLDYQYSDFANEDATIQTLKNNSANAAGNKAVIQAANDIALFQVDQTRKLRVTVMNQINLQSQYMASQNERNEIQEARSERKSSQGKAPIFKDETKVTDW